MFQSQPTLRKLKLRLKNQSSRRKKHTQKNLVRKDRTMRMRLLRIDWLAQSRQNKEIKNSVIQKSKRGRRSRNKRWKMKELQMTGVQPDLMSREGDPTQLKVRRLWIDRTNLPNTQPTNPLANSSLSIKNSCLRIGADITPTSTSNPIPSFLKSPPKFKSPMMLPTIVTKQNSTNASKSSKKSSLRPK